MSVAIGMAVPRTSPDWYGSWTTRDRRVAESFAYAPSAKHDLAAFRTRCTVVRLETVDNDVLGVARWVSFTDVWAGAGAHGSRLWRENPVISVGEGDDPRLVLATQTPVIVFGADNHAHPYARAVIDHIRATCRSVLVVDMGHGLRDHAYADVATFGYDPDRGEALIELLTAAPIAA